MLRARRADIMIKAFLKNLYPKAFFNVGKRLISMRQVTSLPSSSSKATRSLHFSISSHWAADTLYVSFYHLLKLQTGWAAHYIDICVYMYRWIRLTRLSSWWITARHPQIPRHKTHGYSGWIFDGAYGTYNPSLFIKFSQRRGAECDFWLLYTSKD